MSQCGGRRFVTSELAARHTTLRLQLYRAARGWGAGGRGLDEATLWEQALAVDFGSFSQGGESTKA